VSAARAARVPLGAKRARRHLSSQYTEALPGAPDGAYVVIEFQASFEKKASSVERVTPMRDGDGSWRVSGYFIR
jgi:predicted SnoaL-like aldol condensation-catalyzing enzyme